MRNLLFQWPDLRESHQGNLQRNTGTPVCQDRISRDILMIFHAVARAPVYRLDQKLVFTPFR